MQCNTRVLFELLGWRGLLMDGSNESPRLNQHKEFITPHNINELFAKYEVPHEFDLLVTDLDFDDIYYYIKPTEGQVSDWDMLPEEMKTTYERLGIPEAER